jgi:hypothetical protein
MKKQLLIAGMFTMFLGTIAGAQAQTASVSIGGSVAKPFKVDAAVIASMKKVETTVKGHDGKEHHYSGVSLYELLAKAEFAPGNLLKGKTMTKYVLVSAADDYQVVVAIPEFDPAFTDEVIVLADHEDGKALPAEAGPFRLVVPADKKPARSVMKVTKIDVMDARKP